MTTITLPSIGKKPRKRRKPMSAENRALKGAQMKALWADPAFRAKQAEKAAEANRKKWADPEYRAKHLKRLRSLDVKRVACTRLALAERFSDPAAREKMAAQARQMHADGILSPLKSLTQSGLAKRAQHMRRRHEKARGFKIPKHLQKDYDLLVYTKKIPAREAGRMLGLI